MDGVSVGLPQKGSWERRAPVGLGGPRGQWAALVAGGAGHGVRRSVTGQGERRGLDLGSCFVTRSAGGVWGTTWGRKESPALRGECRGIGGILKWLGVPSVVCYNPY
jgi:hypothetical protein